MGILQSYSRLVENAGIIRTTIAPIRLTRFQLGKLFLAQIWRDVLYILATACYSAVREYSRIVENIGIIRTTIAPIRLSRWQLTKLFLAEIWRESSLLTRVTLVLLAATASSVVINQLRRPKSLENLGIPLSGASKGTKADLQKALDDFKTRHPKQPFLISSFGVEYVVFPSQYYDQIKKLPEQKASSSNVSWDSVHEPWLKVPKLTAELAKTISADLPRAIPSLFRGRQRNCTKACEKVFGTTPGWKRVTLFSGLQEIVTSTNASTIVGPELGNTRKWTQLVDRFPVAVLTATTLLNYIPTSLQPLFKPLLFAPAIWLHWSLSTMLTPVIQNDIREYEYSSDKKALLASTVGEKAPLTGWLLNRYKPGYATVKTLVNDLITLSYESTTSSTGRLFFIMGELAAEPKLAETLRREIIQLAPNGNLQFAHLSGLYDMDSVIRESNRTSPFSHLTLYRKLLTPLKLSVGPELPIGTNICVDAHHINFSPAIWGDPARFDGLRSRRQRETTSNDPKTKFANLELDSPGWAGGLQAFPDKTLADNTLKLILAHLLLNYDFKLSPGAEKPAKKTAANGTIYPDMGAKILFRSRAR